MSKLFKIQRRGGISYSVKVLELNPITYLPMNELSGTTATDYGSNGADGTFTGVTLDSLDSPVPGQRAGYWDGVNDYFDFYSATLNTNFDRDEWSYSLWIRPEALGVNTYSFSIFGATDARAVIWRSAADALQSVVQSASGSFAISKTGLTAPFAAWANVIVTWSVSGDENKMFWNGSQVSSTLTSLSSWAADALSTTECVIGSRNTTPANLAKGYFSQFAIFDYALTEVQIATIATV